MQTNNFKSQFTSQDKKSAKKGYDVLGSIVERETTTATVLPKSVILPPSLAAQAPKGIIHQRPTRGLSIFMQRLGQGRAQVEEKEKGNETSSTNTSEESTTLSNSAATPDHVLKGTLKYRPGLPNEVQPPPIQTQRKGATNNDDDTDDD